jgi:saccharopine dehydrogenase-like NADP-dependent oxidoreductase
LKTVLLLFGSVKFSVSLIRYMVVEGRMYGWKTCVGSMFDANIAESIRHEKFSSDVVFINITDYRQCDHAIRKADLVAGILPDSMLLKVADLCIANKKSFITPSKLSRQMLSRKAQIEENGALLLMECGFAPGLDHITAKKAIDNIHNRGGKISSFKSHYGSIVSSASTDNLWEFKLTESSADVIQTGKQSNRYLYKGKILHVPYHQLFSRGEDVSVAGLEDLLVIPEGDALYLKKIYQLQETNTIMKGRILRAGFASLWNLIVRLGLTDSHSKIEMFAQSSFYNFLDSLLPYSEGEHLEHRLKKYAGVTEDEIIKLRWLGLFDEEWVNIKEPTPSVILQHLMEKKFALSPDDKDCILMEHQLEYVVKNIKYNMKATLLAQGESTNDPALTKAIGLVTGAAAKAWLLGNIKVTGLHIPVIPEIYDPILNELDDLGVAFHVEETKVYDFVENIAVEPEKNTNPSSSNLDNKEFQKVLTR